MERWAGKVAVVTGASSGVGLATAKALIKHGVVVVGLARRETQMEENMKSAEGPGKFHAVKCDITKEEDVLAAFDWIKKSLGALNILVNNAGVANHSSVEDTATADLEQVIKVNFMGLLYCSKNAIKLMRETEAEAHIVNINSSLGHALPPRELGIPFNVYPATKFAGRILMDTLRDELHDSKIRVTNISPGLIKTEMMTNNPTFAQMPALEASDVSDAIVYALGTPPHVEINELKLTVRSLKV
ncbi:hypothetical protein QAD02_009404 [Eretmocerus hayati]|uniref:Uncharacterized protein n=1 Tax=Eretmocerus hayati TaxID=131215 RepID=A0ACC2N9Z6_9HYME|nr:hypothetical protein QAD02_009404 [Eretmocerus hayati]